MSRKKRSSAIMFLGDRTKSRMWLMGRGLVALSYRAQSPSFLDGSMASTSCSWTGCLATFGSKDPSGCLITSGSVAKSVCRGYFWLQGHTWLLLDAWLHLYGRKHLDTWLLLFYWLHLVSYVSKPQIYFEHIFLNLSFVLEQTLVCVGYFKSTNLKWPFQNLRNTM